MAGDLQPRAQLRHTVWGQGPHVQGAVRQLGHHITVPKRSVPVSVAVLHQELCRPLVGVGCHCRCAVVCSGAQQQYRRHQGRQTTGIRAVQGGAVRQHDFQQRYK